MELPMSENQCRGKAIIFLADGMADEPLAELGGKTPLEAVDTPFIDSFSTYIKGDLQKKVDYL